MVLRRMFDDDSTRRNMHHRRGVMLLVVMVCIVLAGVSMVSVSRNSLRFASDSIDAERELQCRWGAISLQRTLLKGAPRVFTRLEDQARRSGNASPYASSIRSTVMLGGVKFNALLADENAKVNLNLVYHQRGKSHVQRVVRQLTSVGFLPVRLTAEIASDSLRSPQQADAEPDDKADDDPLPSPPAFQHWGQVFDLGRLQNVPTAGEILAAGTTRLSCWGRGRVNIVRAPDEVVEQVCSLVVSQGVAQRLIREYRENSMLSIAQIAQQIKLEEEEALRLRELIGTKSSDYSLWLTASSSASKQNFFAVAATAEDGTVRTDRFHY